MSNAENDGSGGTLLSSASFLASPSKASIGNTETRMTRIKVHKAGNYGYANVAQGVFRVDADGEECVVDAVTAQNLADMDCCEILGEVVPEDAAEPKSDGDGSEVKPDAKPKRGRGRRIKE